MLLSKCARVREEPDLSKTIYVGNLAVATTEQALRELFQPFGLVKSMHVAMDIDTGRARGFATVVMDDDAAAGKAIRELDGREVDGQALRVGERHNRQDGSGGRGYGR